MLRKGTISIKQKSKYICDCGKVDLLERICPFFDKYPLQTAKNNDFDFNIPNYNKKEITSDLDEITKNRKIVLARELTKIHEEYIRGTVSEILEVVEELKGEMVLIIEGKKEDDVTSDLNSLSIKEHYNFYIEQGIHFKEALKMVAKDRKVSKSIIYQEIFGKNKD